MLHILALASRCLCFIHPLLQVPPEWRGLGAKPMVGELSHSLPTSLHLHSHAPVPDS